MKKILFLIISAVLFYKVAAASDVGIIKTVQEAYEFYSVGNYEEAAPIFEEAYNIVTKNSKNDISGRFKLALYAGLSYRGLEEYPKAVGWFETALGLSDKIKDKSIPSSILAYMGETERLAGNYDKSASYYLEAISKGFVSIKEKAVLYYGLAETYRLWEDYEKAKEACDMASTLSASLSMEQLNLSCEIVKGESYRMSGDYARALKSFRLVLDMARARKYPDLAIAALNGLGLTSETLGRKDAARSNFEEALSLSIKNENYESVELLADKIASLIPYGNFRNKAEETLKIIENSELLDSYVKSPLWRLAGSYYKASGDNDAALSAYQNSYLEAVSASSQTEAIAALYDLAVSMRASKKYYSAIVRLDEAASRGKASSYPHMGKIYALKSECFVNLQKYEEASILMEEAAKYDKKYNSRLEEIKKMIPAGEEIEEENPDNITINEEDLRLEEDNKYEIEKTDETPVG